MSKPMLCADCGTRTTGKTITPGSFLVEFALWCFFLVPGLVYSLWRLSARKRGCHACGNDRLIPTDSPLARAIANGVNQGASR